MEMTAEVKTFLEGIQQQALDAIKQHREQLDKKYAEAIAAGAPAAEVKLELERIIKRMDNMQQEIGRPVGGDGSFTQAKTLGQIVTESDVMAEVQKKMGSSGASVRGSRATIPINGSFFGEEMKTTITSAAVGSSTPGILIPERMPGIVKPGVRRLRVRDLMSRLPTSNNAVEYLKENAFTNAGSPVAETISKPESALTFTIASATVKTIASWIPAAKQILDDLPALRAYINQRLLEGLMDVEDYELVSGDGSGNHLAGLTHEATAYDTARNASGDTYIDKINHAISQVEDVLQEADGIILHPRDWRTMQLVKDQASNVGNYVLGGPRGDAQPILWGLPVATTTAVQVGHFYVGAFKRYCTVWDRMAAIVEIATEHADFFVRNMVAILAEERIAFTVQRSDAVVYGSF